MKTILAILFLAISFTACTKDDVRPSVSQSAPNGVTIGISTTSNIQGNEVEVVANYTQDEQHYNVAITSGQKLDLKKGTVLTLTPTVKQGNGSFKEFRVDGVPAVGSTFTITNGCTIVAVFEMEPSGQTN